MVGLDPAVEDAHANAGARRPAPRPLARDLAGPRLGERDPLDGVGGEAPGGERVLCHEGRGDGGRPSSGRSVSSKPPGDRSRAPRRSDPRGNAGAVCRRRARGRTGGVFAPGRLGTSLGKGRQTTAGGSRRLITPGPPVPTRRRGRPPPPGSRLCARVGPAPTW